MPTLKNRYQNKLLEAGCDEAGRGCLAGPVTAAAVILPKNYHHPLLNDSKLLTKKQRDVLRIDIEEKAVAWAVAFVPPKKIDEINILQASFLAVHKALGKLQIKPELIVMDGNRFKPYKKIPHHCEVKGDGKFANIAAASVLAKTHRDEYMQKLAKKFKGYGWQTNKGYPTKAHRKGIEAVGPCKHHRKSFKLLPILNEELC